MSGRLALASPVAPISVATASPIRALNRVDLATRHRDETTFLSSDQPRCSTGGPPLVPPCDKRAIHVAVTHRGPQRRSPPSDRPAAGLCQMAALMIQNCPRLVDRCWLALIYACDLHKHPLTALDHNGGPTNHLWTRCELDDCPRPRPTPAPGWHPSRDCQLRILADHGSLMRRKARLAAMRPEARSEDLTARSVHRRRVASRAVSRHPFEHHGQNAGCLADTLAGCRGSVLPSCR